MLHVLTKLGHRLAVEEELAKHAGVDLPVLLKHVLPALGLGGLLGYLGDIAGSASITAKDVQGPLWGALPPTQGQVDIARQVARARGALLGAALGAGMGGLAPYWAPALLKETKTLGRAVL